MELLTFSVFDSKCVAYMAPFFMNSRGQALRAFQDLSDDPQSMIFKHPADFTLFETGTYDDQTGIVTPISHVNLGKAIEFQNKDERNAAASISNGPQLLPSSER